MEDLPEKSTEYHSLIFEFTQRNICKYLTYSVSRERDLCHHVSCVPSLD